MQPDSPESPVPQSTFPRGLLFALLGLWCLAAGVVIAALVLPERATMMAAAARDLARFAAMIAVGATVAAIAIRFVRRRFVAVLGVAAAVTMLGVAVETQESLTGGYFSWSDIATNLLAAGCGLAVVQAAWDQAKRIVWGALAAVGAAASLLVFADFVLLYAQRDAQQPVLIDAQSARQQRWVRPVTPPVRRVVLPPEWAQFAGERAFEVPLGQGDLPGFALDEPLKDWSAWQRVALEVVNPGRQPLSLVLNIDDMRGSGRPGDRYDERVTLPPGRRVVLRTPFATISRALPHRRFAFEDMDIVYLYAEQAMPGAKIYVTKAWLE
ncbi:MAG: hypothetical protein R3E65_06110 [Steroidobacteraceae bacterium]